MAKNRLLTLLPRDEGEVVPDGNIRIDDVSAQAGVQVIGPEVLLHAVVADDFLTTGKAGTIVAGRGDVVWTGEREG